MKPFHNARSSDEGILPGRKAEPLKAADADFDDPLSTQATYRSGSVVYRWRVGRPASAMASTKGNGIGKCLDLWREPFRRLDER
jgi:hypothetical protein